MNTVCCCAKTYSHSIISISFSRGPYGGSLRTCDLAFRAYCRGQFISICSGTNCCTSCSLSFCLTTHCCCTFKISHSFIAQSCGRVVNSLSRYIHRHRSGYGTVTDRNISRHRTAITDIRLSTGTHGNAVLHTGEAARTYGNAIYLLSSGCTVTDPDARTSAVYNRYRCSPSSIAESNSRRIARLSVIHRSAKGGGDPDRQEFFVNGFRISSHKHCSFVFVFCLIW